MNVQRLAAFCDGDTGGNPAGVYIADEHPPVVQMQSIAAAVGYSETAFARPSGEQWRVRYFSPETEVPFCGHATIALGAALTRQFGDDVFDLVLNENQISVEGFTEKQRYWAALQSPPTHSRLASDATVSEALDLFGYKSTDLDDAIPPGRANGGADHLVIGLSSRRALSAMNYSLAAGRTFMRDANLVTVMFVYRENARLFHCRNPFASGGVYEDPATGAAAAAFAGYLRDLSWPHEGEIDLVQGEDMGSRSLINAKIPEASGSSICVSGAARFLSAPE